jgi:anthranilate phosphoribosyltransferase
MMDARQSMKATIGAMLDGTMDAVEATTLLSAQDLHRIMPEQLAGAVDAVMERANPFPAFADAVDCCGTGGDGQHSLNISTATALVVASCGVQVAKHGNRAVSSRSGSADVLAALGVNIEAATHTLERCLHEVGIAFLFAPNFHTGFARVAPLRKALGKRTIFNLLGPLCNPAHVRRQLIGVFDKALIPTYTAACQLLGREHVLIVHGEDGADECSISTPTLTNTHTITPLDAGLPYHAPDALKGGDAAHNAAALYDMLSGAHGAYRDAVLLNAAALLMVADIADDLKTAAVLAAEAIDSGRSLAVLEKLKQVSHE